MKKILLFIPALLILLGSTQISAGVSIGISADEDGIKSFHLAIGDFYGVDRSEINIVVKNNIPDDELPIVFFIAKHAGVRPKAIIKLRLRGLSWMEITHHFDLSAGIYYYPVTKTPGPPYGKAYGHFKNKPKNKWHTISLTDLDIINFVNLRFISLHYGYSPEEVIKLRASGNKFVKINKAVKAKKAKHKQKKIAAKDEKKKSGRKKKGKK